MKLREKTIIVTGGAGGIGSRLVERLAGLNAEVGVFDMDQARLKTFEGREGLHPHLVDITDPDAVEEQVGRFAERTGRIDVLVNNAGVVVNQLLAGFGPGGLAPHGLDEWKKALDVNLTGSFLMARAVAARMIAARTRGVIVNISSICAEGNAGQSAYSATKAGLEALTVTWAKELAAWRIRVGAVAPGYVNTEAAISSMPSEALDNWVGRTPLRRLADPDEIVDAVLFVLENDFFNGRVLAVDGGLRM